MLCKSTDGNDIYTCILYWLLSDVLNSVVVSSYWGGEKKAILGSVVNCFLNLRSIL